jgi:hypothetical protein
LCFSDDENFIIKTTRTLVKTGLVVRREKELANNSKVSSPIDGELPLFLRGGFGVAFQMSKKITKVADLGNEYYIKAALSQKRTQDFPELTDNQYKLIGISQGDILGKIFI